MDSVEKVVSEMRQTCEAEGQSDTDMTRRADRLEALMKEPVGVMCLGCGSSWDDDRLREEKERNPKIVSCCPERRMVPVPAATPSHDLEAQCAAMREALTWFVENDDTNDTPDNAYWLEGLAQGKEALSTDAGRELLERLRKAEDTLAVAQHARKTQFAEASRIINHLRALYHAVNKMMATLGANGEITSEHESVIDVMNALHDIDGGSYE